MKTKVNGTPQTLAEAIANGLEDIAPQVKVQTFFPSDCETVKKVELHVRDFMAQKFGPAMLDENKEAIAKEIWSLIFKEAA